MPIRTWATALAATLGIAALAGASQLGLAYGLGILRLARVLDVTTRDQWTAQLAWVAWIAMASAVIGGMLGRLRLPARSGTGLRILAAVAAGLGGAVVVPLTMQPARTAQIAGVQPVFVIGVCAGLGALIGIFGAYAAINRQVARWSLTTVGAAVWVIAIVSVAPSLAPGDPLPAIRLGVFDASSLGSGVTQRTALFTMPALALISGALLGWTARRREMSTLTIAMSGLAGPALLTLAYLIAGPGNGADRFQVVPYWAAMTAAGAGVLGSVLAAVLGRGPAAGEGDLGDDPGDGEPTPDRPPLPKRDVQQESAIALAAARPEEPPRPVDTQVFAPFVPAKASASARVEPQPMNPPPMAPPPLMPPPMAPPPMTHEPFREPAAQQFREPAAQQFREPAEQQFREPAEQPFGEPAAAPQQRNRADRRAQQDGDFVDWVSGLGNQG